MLALMLLYGAARAACWRITRSMPSLWKLGITLFSVEYPTDKKRSESATTTVIPRTVRLVLAFRRFRFFSARPHKPITSLAWEHTGLLITSVSRKSGGR